MTVEQCFFGVCFVPMNGNGHKLFGFAEFLASLALMVLAWTIADVRYRFRVRTAPIDLLSITFAVVTTVGVLSLLTDLWRAEQWLVPKEIPLTQAAWQAILGGVFLATFLTWAWFAFIRPATYGRHNAQRFALTLYWFIIKGSPDELPVIADELAYSAQALVHHATDRRRLTNDPPEGAQKKDPPQVEGYANDILLLIADKRLCRSIVGWSPGTALALFQAMADTKKYGIQVETFANNIVNEALANKDSFLYHEAEGYETGLVGYQKPLSQAMFANYDMVEAVGSMLDIDTLRKPNWDADQWEAYCRVVLMVFRDYVQKRHGAHSYALYRALGNIQHAVSDLYTLNQQASIWDTDSSRRLSVVVEFIKGAVKILEDQGVSVHVRKRVREDHGQPRETFFDHIASMILGVIDNASAVTSPQSGCWTIQHNLVWGKLFNFNRLDDPAGRMVKFKVRRLLYDEIAKMRDLPNYKGARILGFCLNVMGLTIGRQHYDRDSRALQKAVLAWTRKNFMWLHGYNPRVAEACLVDGMTFDVANRRLIRTSLAQGLNRASTHVFLELDPAPPG